MAAEFGTLVDKLNDMCEKERERAILRKNDKQQQNYIYEVFANMRRELTRLVVQIKQS